MAAKFFTGLPLQWRAAYHELMVAVPYVRWGTAGQPYLFIYAMGRLRVDAPPIVESGSAADPSQYADPLPQALVLTAIVISFAMTALLLVVLLASRGLTGTDHVDGKEPD